MCKDDDKWQYLGDWTVKDALDVLSKDGPGRKGLEDWEKIHGMLRFDIPPPPLSLWRKFALLIITDLL